MEMLCISIHPRDGKLNELLRICQYLTDETRRGAGCANSELMKDTEHVITLKQQWEHLAHMNNYFHLVLPRIYTNTSYYSVFFTRIITVFILCLLHSTKYTLY